MRIHRHPKAARAGFTIVEVAVTVLLFTTLMSSFVISVNRLGQEHNSNTVQYELARDALEGMRSITSELSRAGFVEEAGIQYPSVIRANNYAEFPTFKHDAPHLVHGAQQSTQLVYVLPEDADSDGWPELVSNSDPSWGATEFGYVLEPEDDGTNTLRLRGSDGSNRVILRDVARITFESPADTGFAIPLNAVRVRLELARTTPEGTVLRRQVEEVVRLRNGGLAP